MEDQRTRKLQNVMHTLVYELSLVASEDKEAQRTKIFAALAEVDQPLRAIHGVLNGKMWDPDDLDTIAVMLETAGFEIEAPQ